MRILQQRREKFREAKRKYENTTTNEREIMRILQQRRGKLGEAKRNYNNTAKERNYENIKTQETEIRRSKEKLGEYYYKAMLWTRIRIHIQIGSGFNGVSGSGSRRAKIT
jgi:hypothetical protein